MHLDSSVAITSVCTVGNNLKIYILENNTTEMAISAIPTVATKKKELNATQMKRIHEYCTGVDYYELLSACHM